METDQMIQENQRLINEMHAEKEALQMALLAEE